MKFISKNKKYVKSAINNAMPEVKEGVFAGTTRGFGFVQIEGEDDVFVPEKDTKGALHGDTVLVQIASNGETGKKREGKIVKIVKRDAIYDNHITTGKRHLIQGQSALTKLGSIYIPSTANSIRHKLFKIRNSR